MRIPCQFAQWFRGTKSNNRANLVVEYDAQDMVRIHVYTPGTPHLETQIVVAGAHLAGLIAQLTAAQEANNADEYANALLAMEAVA